MRLGKWIAIIFLLSIFAFLVPATATDHEAAATHDTEHGSTHGAEHAVAESHGHGDAGHGGHGGHINLGEVLKLWSCIPFACMLLSIALFPLLAPKFWHHHFGKVSAFWAACLAIPFLIAYKGTAVYEILHIILADYVPFIILLWVDGYNRSCHAVDPPILKGE